MTIDDDKLDELERCAEAATEGPWMNEFEGVYTDPRPANEATMVATAEREEVFPELGSRPADIDAMYIAAADPPTVLALVEEVRRLRAEVRELKAYDEGTVVDGTDCCGAETYTSSCLKTGQHRDFCCKCGEVVEDTDE